MTTEMKVNAVIDMIRNKPNAALESYLEDMPAFVVKDEIADEFAGNPEATPEEVYANLVEKAEDGI